MNKTYKFYGIERSNDWRIGFISFSTCSLIAIFLFKLNLDYGFHHLGSMVQCFLFFAIIVGFMISIFVVYIWLFKLTIEYWEIDYDKTNLNINSNKRDQITIPFTELMRLQLFKEKTPVVENHAIQFESSNYKLRIDVRVTGDILCRKKDLLVFYKFYRSLLRDIIQHDYIVAGIRSQTVTPNFRSVSRLPASILLVRKPEH